MVTFDIYSNPARRLKYGVKLRVGHRCSMILQTGFNLLIKSRWRWGKKRRNIRLEPIFLIVPAQDADDGYSASDYKLVGVYCAPEDLPDLPWRFTA